MPSLSRAEKHDGIFAKLVPVLPVADLMAEVRFYTRLGFEASQTMSGFTALRHGDVLFGLQESTAPVPPPGLQWQMWSENLSGVEQLAIAGGIEVVSGPAPHPAGFWTLQLLTPNNYILTMEGPAPLQMAE